MKIKKDRITIRNATVDDANLLTSWWNDGSVMAHAGFPNGLGITVEQVKEQLGFRKVRTNYHSWRDQLGNMQSSVDYELEKEQLR